jgi:hypothetical protein
LTGNLSAISQDDLRRQGYPARPDPVASPKLYSQWAESVSRPWTSVQLIPIADFSGGFGYYGECNSGGWTGMVQAAASFSSYCSANSTTAPGQLYSQYVLNTFIPVNEGNCDSPCSTGLWAGVGGYGNTSLPQHGFDVTGSSAVDFMWEWFVPGASANTYPLYSQYQPNDNIQLWGVGVSSNSCSAASDNAAPWFCFHWYDLTSNYNAWITLQNPSTAQFPWSPNTFEFVAEVRNPGGYHNAEYGGSGGRFVTGSGWAVDYYGTAHYDDGNGGSDVYIYNRDSSQYNLGYWGPTGLPQSPADPWVLQFNHQ